MVEERSHKLLRKVPAVGLIVLLALSVLAVLAVAGCTRGGKKPPPANAAPTTTTLAPIQPAPLALELATSAKGPERGFDARKAAQTAAPGLKSFLNRYLTSAFLRPAERQKGWAGLLALFDSPVRDSAERQIDSLSLGDDAAKVTVVRPDRAKATAVVLFGGGRPAAATVRLSFDGIAGTAQGPGEVHLRSVLQLLNTSNGWRIAAYQSKTGSGA